MRPLVSLLSSSLVACLTLVGCSQSRTLEGDGGHLDAQVSSSPDSGARADAGSRDAAIAWSTIDANVEGGVPFEQCPSGACALDGTGCPTGQRCSAKITPDNELITECVDLRAAGQIGDTCTEDIDCRRGLGCADGACHPYCCGGSDAFCSNGERCLVEFRNPNTNEGLGFGACTDGSTCDFVTQSGCDSGETCYIASLDGQTICARPAGSLAEGATCTPSRNDPCALGMQCLSSGGSAVCRRFCNSQSGTGCESDQRCAMIVIENKPNAGVCIAGT